MKRDADRSGIHFGVAGILSCLSMILGGGCILAGLAIPAVPTSPLILMVHALTAGAIIFSIIQSIRMIGRGLALGWSLLLGNCFCAVVVTAIITIHAMCAILMAAVLPA